MLSSLIYSPSQITLQDICNRLLIGVLFSYSFCSFGGFSLKRLQCGLDHIHLLLLPFYKLPRVTKYLLNTSLMFLVTKPLMVGNCYKQQMIELCKPSMTVQIPKILKDSAHGLLKMRKILRQSWEVNLNYSGRLRRLEILIIGF